MLLKHNTMGFKDVLVRFKSCLVCWRVTGFGKTTHLIYVSFSFFFNSLKAPFVRLSCTERLPRSASILTEKTWTGSKPNQNKPKCLLDCTVTRWHTGRKPRLIQVAFKLFPVLLNSCELFFILNTPLRVNDKCVPVKLLKLWKQS